MSNTLATLSFTFKSPRWNKFPDELRILAAKHEVDIVNLETSNGFIFDTGFVRFRGSSKGISQIHDFIKKEGLEDEKDSNK